MDMSVALMMVIVSQVCTYPQTHQVNHASITWFKKKEKWLKLKKKKEAHG